MKIAGGSDTHSKWSGVPEAAGRERQTTVLLRGGHQWVCAFGGNDAALTDILASLHTRREFGKVFILPLLDGRSLAVPELEIVGVVGDEFPQGAPIQVQAPAAQPEFQTDYSLARSPFFRIENFLTEDELARVMAYALDREPAFAGATVTTSSVDYRRAKVLYDVADLLPWFLPKIQALIPSVWPLLRLQPAALKTIECQLTAHGAGDFFKLHNDSGSADTAARTVSYVYYFHRQPKAFSGGALRIFETVEQDGFYRCGAQFADIEPGNNSIVFFPSYCHHEVTPVQSLSEQFADRRFTVNGWLVRAA